MLVVRPVQPDDLDQLFELSKQTTFGLTTLPTDRDFLAKRIDDSVHGFARISDRPRGEAYLFVAEDTETKRIAGTCGVVAKVGGFEPFYAYRIERSVHESKTLGVRKEVRALHLIEEHNGPCEIGSLFLSPDYRGGGNGRMLSLVRFLFMADHQDHFDPDVIAEMRGVIDENGRSSFWDALGKHFFDLEFPKADYLSILNKEFIGELMPRHPIYVPLLPHDAQRAIGHVHQNTTPALRVLESEGFRFNDMVDIFEAGPIVSCQLKDIRTIRESVRDQVSGIVDSIESVPYLISNTLRDYRGCQGMVESDSEGVKITPDVADALKLKIGDPIRVVTAKPAG